MEPQKATNGDKNKVTVVDMEDEDGNLCCEVPEARKSVSMHPAGLKLEAN